MENKKEYPRLSHCVVLPGNFSFYPAVNELVPRSLRSLAHPAVSQRGGPKRSSSAHLRLCELLSFVFDNEKLAAIIGLGLMLRNENTLRHRAVKAEESKPMKKFKIITRKLEENV